MDATFWTDFWTAFGAIGTCLAVVVALGLALFQDRIRAYMFRPRLCIRFEPIAPMFQTTHIPNTQNPDEPIFCYALRLKITNCGNSNAENVKVICEDTGSNTFVPNTLRWTNNSSPLLDYIAPNGGKAYFDLGYLLPVMEHGVLLQLSTPTEISTHSHNLLPGDHVITLMITCSSGIAFRGALHLTFGQNAQQPGNMNFLQPTLLLSIAPFDL